MQSEPTRLQMHFRDMHQQHDASLLGMWIFLVTELMVFGGLFTGYSAYRLQYPHAFKEASGQLELMIGAINTVVLLTSSLTMVLAVHAARHGQRRGTVMWLLVTAALGAMFLLIKAYEYWEDYQKRLVPWLAFRPEDWREPNQVKLFLNFYYVMTGLHALHLIVGIGLLGVLAFLTWRGRFSEDYNAPVEVGGLYWHFVDVVWIFLLPLLYLVGTRS